MNAAAEELDFERAAWLRDDLGALRRALEKQAVVLATAPMPTWSPRRRRLEAAVQVFHVRAAGAASAAGWWKSPATLGTRRRPPWWSSSHPVLRRPGRIGRRGRRIHQPCAPRSLWSRVAAERRRASPRGCRGSGARAWRCVSRSAATRRRSPRPYTATPRRPLQQHKLKRAGDFTARSAALQNIQESLGLADAPLRIECIDISHVQGTDVVGSLVVFEDGLPRKSDYRHFAIREAAGEGRSDDVASIAEVTRRRFLRHLQDAPSDASEDGAAGRPADSPTRQTFSWWTAAHCR